MTKEKKCWKQNGTKQSVKITTRTIVHPCLDVSVIRDVTHIPRIIFNTKLALQAVQRQPIFILDIDYDDILDEIESRDSIDYERPMNNYDKCKQYIYNFLIIA